MCLLNAVNISASYGKKQILYNIDISVKSRQNILLIGGNGSGKSTLAKVLTGLIPRLHSNQESTILFEKEKVTFGKTHRLIKKGLLYIPQKDDLFENMTVRQNIKSALLNQSNKNNIEHSVQCVLDKFSVLREKRNQLARTLSGGERKLLSLGMIWGNNPKLVIYDEPLAGLGSKNSSLVLNCINELKDRGTTFLFIEHRIREVFEVSDKVIGLRNGRIHHKELHSIDQIKSFLI